MKLEAVDYKETGPLKRKYEFLAGELSVYQTKLNELQLALSNLDLDKAESSDERSLLLTDQRALNNLITMVNLYLHEIKCTSILGIRKDRMSKKDIDALNLIEAGIKNMHKYLTAPEKDKLSVLIEDASKCHYDVSYTRTWLRRGALLLAGLIVGAIVITAAVIFMTPGINLIAVAAAIPTTLLAAAAFIGLRSTVTSAYSLDGFSVPMNVPSNLGLATAPLAGVWMLRKSLFKIVDPSREVAARNLQLAQINKLSVELIKKINLFEEGDVKKFLLAVTEEAKKMVNDGASSYFYEAQSSKIEKGCLILKATARIIENEKLNDIKTILDEPIKNDYTYRQLISAQRYSGLFKNKTSALAYRLMQKGVPSSLLQSEKALTLRSISMAPAAA